MKKKLRFAAGLCAAALMLGTLPVSAEEYYPQFSWRTDSGSVIDGLRPLEDKGIFGDSWQGQIYYQYSGTESGTLFRIVPRQNVLTFHLRDVLEPEQAEAKMSEILIGFFPDLHDNVYRKMGPTEEERTADFNKRGTYGYYEADIYPGRTVQPEKIMNSLYDAGLIDEFYTYGESALYEVISTDLTHYFPTAVRVNPETNRNEEISIDWDAVEAWLTAQHPDCSLERPLPEDDDQRYTVTVPERMSYDKHLALAVELYGQFGISPIAGTPAILPQLLLGTNQLTVKQYGGIGVMYERIAGWENTTVDQCLVVSDTQFLTPTKPYEIHKVRYSPYRITFRKGTKPDWDAIFSKWVETLREAGYPESSLKYFEYETPDMPASEDFADVYDFRTSQDAWKEYSLLDILKEVPEIEKVEAHFGYRTDSRPNGTGDYAIQLVIDPNENEQADIREILDGIREISPVPDSSLSLIYLEDDSYSAYFEAMKKLIVAAPDSGACLRYTSTCLADANEDAVWMFPEYDVLFTREAPETMPESAPLQQYYNRIAGWENTTLDNCIILSDRTMLTPNKPYHIEKTRCSPYRFYLKEGTTLDKDELLAKWRQMMLDAGYAGENLDAMLERDIGGMEFEASEGGYLVKNARDDYGGVTLADCLKRFPQVMRIETEYCYMTYDRVNYSGDYCFTFRSSREISAADFPGINLSQLELGPEEILPIRCRLWLATSDYASYFQAAQILQSLDFVSGLNLNFSATELADLQEDTPMRLGFETIFARYDPETALEIKSERAAVEAYGDMNEDGTIDISDAVLLARFAAEDPDANIARAVINHADLDSDGYVNSSDVIVILRYIAKLI